MYLHLGADEVVKKSEIIGIFDIENTSVSKDTRDFLSKISKNSEVFYVNNEMPKSFIVCQRNGKNFTYISPISAATLKKRYQNFQEFPF